MKTVTETLKLELFDYGPKHKNPSPDEIVSITGMLTSKKGSFEEALKKLTPQKVEAFHKESTRRGHASLTTTPVF